MFRVPLVSGMKCVGLAFPACKSRFVSSLGPSTPGFVPIVGMGIVCLDCL